MEIIKNPEAIISAIDAYIEKSDKNLENELRAAGYVRTAEAVALIEVNSEEVVWAITSARVVFPVPGGP